MLRFFCFAHDQLRRLGALGSRRSSRRRLGLGQHFFTRMRLGRILPGPTGLCLIGFYLIHFLAVPLSLAATQPTLATARPFASTPPRTVFVHLFEWSWNDVARECETVLGPQGFAAVQVSPPFEHVRFDGAPWWERYQPVSYKLESRSGDERELREMIRRCANAGVDVYVDAIINHMAGIESGIGQAGTPFARHDYPGIYSPGDFHLCGKNRANPHTYDDVVDWTNRAEVQNCELLNLADLATEKPAVRQTLAAQLDRLLDMGVVGFRLDATKHVPSNDIRAILDLLKRSPYIIQELILDPREPFTDQEYRQNGDRTVFDYAYDVGRAFRSGELWRLKKVGSQSRSGIPYPHSSEAIVFIENHDLQRLAWAQRDLVSFQNTNDLARLAQVFMLAWPYGYPQVLSSYRFNNFDDGPPIDSQRRNRPVLTQSGDCSQPWLCEHRQPEVAPMVQFRNLTDSHFFVTDWWATDTQVAFGRGRAGFIAINSGNETLQRSFQTSLTPGWYCDILAPTYDLTSRSCKSGQYKVNSDGSVLLELAPKAAIAFHFGTEAKQSESKKTQMKITPKVEPKVKPKMKPR